MKQKKIKQRVFLITLLCCYFTSLTYAQHQDEAHQEKTKHHHHHKHHVAVFNGATSNFSHHNTHYAIGLDYEYRVGDFLGTGIIGEYVAVEKGEWIGGIPIFMHFTKNMKMVVAPILINKEEHHTDDHHHAETSREADIAIRLGGSYSFHLGSVALSPTVNYDVGESHALVYGLSVGIGF